MKIDKILEDESAKLGGFGGFIGGGVAGATGGAIGAKIGASMLPTVTYQHSLIYMSSLENAIKAVNNSIVTSGGYKKMLDADKNSQIPMFSAIIGSGLLNLNPAVVCVTVEYINETRVNICITGHAKEGLIKQKTAQKAVLRIAENLESV